MSIKFAARCAFRWLTPIKGLSYAKARVLAAFIPTRRQPTSPGPTVLAKAVTSFPVTPACLNVSSMTTFIASRCSLAAISGITPPNSS